MFHSTNFELTINGTEVVSKNDKYTFPKVEGSFDVVVMYESLTLLEVTLLTSQILVIPNVEKLDFSNCGSEELTIEINSVNTSTQCLNGVATYYFIATNTPRDIAITSDKLVTKT